MKESIASFNKNRDEDNNFEVGVGFIAGEKYYYFLNKHGNKYYEDQRIKAKEVSICDLTEGKPRYTYDVYEDVKMKTIFPTWLIGKELNRRNEKLHIPKNTNMHNIGVIARCNIDQEDHCGCHNDCGI